MSDLSAWTGTGADAYARCAAGGTLRAACAGLVEDLATRWSLPSVYLLLDGRLRCQASRGYFQVSDGFSPDTGVLGRVVTSGRTVVLDDVSLDPSFIAAIPGLRSEVSVPIRVFDQVVGAVTVESRDEVDDASVGDLERGAALLGARLEALGGLPPVSLPERLARVAVDLASQTTLQRVRERAVQGALEISGKSSGALARLGRDGWAVCHAAGPLAPVLRGWDDGVLSRLAAWVGHGTSSYFPDDEQAPAGYGLAAGVHALAVQPLLVAGRVAGLLVTADAQPAPHDPAVTSALELLAVHAAAMLRTMGTLEDLAHQALHDPLTGLVNRRGLMEDLHAAADGAGADAALVLLDLDGFKAVNDHFGHAHGDAVLRDVGLRLRAAARDGDLVCRLGGDEFAVLARGVDGPSAAAAAGARFVAAVSATRGLAEHPTVGASAGVRLIAGESASDVLIDADKALYAAKHSARGSSVVWDPGLRREEHEQEALVRDLVRALRDDALTLEFQPVADIVTLRVRGLEALARWHHPVLGPVPPARFVEHAERAGVVRDLTRWVLHSAFTEAARWPAAPDGDLIKVSVNISAAQLGDDAVVGDVRAALAATGLSCHRVVLEVTETAEVVDLARAKTTLEALTDVGVTLALDDFGTGHSSLTHAQVLPFDIVKIDRSFVRAARSGDQRAIATIAAVCAFAAPLHVDVVAEGVEDQAHLAELTAAGCHYAQGHALARPLRGADVVRALREHVGPGGWTLQRAPDR